METSKKISALNELIVINNDRVEGYDTASKEAEDVDLKSLFAGLQTTSETNLSELHAEVRRLGGQAEEGTRTTGKFHRVWMDVKAVLTGNERGTILNSCEFGESKALEAYREVLDDSEYLSEAQVVMIQNQYAALKSDHDKIRVLHNAETAK
jgi:uncharacterized protein (TIGR02284 family)